MTPMLELPHRELRIPMSTVLKVLKEKVDNLKEQMVMWQRAGSSKIDSEKKC